MIERVEKPGEDKINIAKTLGRNGFPKNSGKNFRKILTFISFRQMKPRAIGFRKSTTRKKELGACQ